MTRHTQKPETQKPDTVVKKKKKQKDQTTELDTQRSNYWNYHMQIIRQLHYYVYRNKTQA